MHPGNLRFPSLTAAALVIVAACTTNPSLDKSRDKSPLLDTTRSAETAPENFRVRFETTNGPLTIEAHRAWAPWGVDRFYYLVRNGFYDSTAFSRVIPGFIAQFGISGNPEIAASWRQRLFPDDTIAHQTNSRGRISFATAGPMTRNTQLFINLRDNPTLDKDYAPFGEIVDGMTVIDSLWSGYGDMPPNGRGPDPSRIFTEGNAYLRRDFPQLDYILTARIAK
ncbi:MAG TPA: peptidylprolyl isomerase [Gemmatimonadaceae bacterium]|nr:peptidylprolyl isomerase [Gemmatimonadaceae bacterium]